ncbi:hypothetical protein LSAT2_020048, partial [Lamellibrachia satsuma]
ISLHGDPPRSVWNYNTTTKDGMSSEDQWTSARSRTLILSGDRAGTPYFREDFLNGLKLVLGDGISQIVSFGPLAKNTEWFLMVKSERARDNLLAAGVVKVKGGVFRVRSADSTQFRVRIHWAPPFIPNDVIINHLSQYGKVLSCVNEMSVSKGFENVATGVRTVVMCGNKADLPHFFVVVDKSTKQTFQLLVTVTGRPPICLRCNKVGHFRRECTTPYCRHHGEYGHKTEECSAVGSYAGVLRGKNNAEPEPVDIEEVSGTAEGSFSGQVKDIIVTMTEADKRAVLMNEVETATGASGETEIVVPIVVPVKGDETEVVVPVDMGVEDEEKIVEMDVVVTGVEGEGKSGSRPAPQSDDMFSGSESMSSDGEGEMDWNLVARNKKRKRVGKRAVIKNTSPLSPASPVLGRLVI